MSNGCFDEAKLILDKCDYKERHSYFQLKNFIIDQEPTHQGKLWQCIREIKSRFDTLKSINLEIDNQKDLIELEKFEIRDFTNVHDMNIRNNPECREALKSKIMQRKLESMQNTLNQIEFKKKNVEEELAFLIKCYDELNAFDKVKSFDDFNSQQEYWGKKFGADMDLRYLLGMTPDFNLIKSILSLNNNNPVKDKLLVLISQLKNRVESLNKVVEEQKISEK